MKRRFALVDTINELEPEMEQLSDEELRAKTDEFRERVDPDDPGSLDAILPEAFAVVREAAKRSLGMRLYDVQLVGASVLHEGAVAEMKTGEGKTLTAVPAVYLNALLGRGVHMVTVNDYLAKRDAEWMGPIYELLGISVGVIEPMMPEVDPPRAVRLRRDLRDQLGIRVRLPPRQHGRSHRGLRPARPLFLHRGRGRLDPHRRGANPADHLRHPGGGGRHLLPLRPRHPDPQEGRGLRDRREAAHRLADRERRRQGGEGPRNREPVPRHQRGAREPPGAGPACARPLPPRRRVHRPRRRGADRRRVHRARPRGAPVLGGAPPGDRGEGGRRDPRGEPDPRDDHAAELLPHVREAERHDRYRRDRGHGVRQDLQDRGRVDPDEPADGPRRPERPHLQDAGREVERGRRGHRRDP